MFKRKFWVVVDFILVEQVMLRQRQDSLQELLNDGLRSPRLDRSLLGSFPFLDYGHIFNLLFSWGLGICNCGNFLLVLL